MNDVEGDFVIVKGNKCLRCKAKSKKNEDGRCKRAALKGKTLCASHGGKRQGEPSNNSTLMRNARRYLPSRLAIGYAEHIQDETLISLQRDLATLEAMIDETTKGMEEGAGNAQLWKKARELVNEYKRDEDPRVLKQLVNVFNSGIAVKAMESELLGLIERRRKLAEAEHKRIKDAHESMTKRDAIALMAMIVQIVNKHVTDDGIKDNIARDIDRVATQGNSGTTLVEIASRN